MTIIYFDCMTNAQLIKEIREYARLGEFTRNYGRCLREIERRLSEMPLVVTNSVSVHHDLIDMKVRLDEYRRAADRANNECSYMKKSYEDLLSTHNALADDRLRLALEDIRITCASALAHSS